MRFLRSGVRGFAFFGIACSTGECKNRVRAEYDMPAGEIDHSRMRHFSAWLAVMVVVASGLPVTGEATGTTLVCSHSSIARHSY